MESRLNATEYVEARQDNRVPPEESRSSGVSWGAVIGGAFVTAAFYLVLIALGAGFGLSAVSPWAGFGVSASAFGAAAIVWLILSEVISSALGGYLTGRLRTKWSLIHNDEVYFRDTANGFLAWAVALVVSAGFLSTAAASMAGVAAEARVTDPNAYYADALLRSDQQAPETKDPSLQAEAGRILVNALRQPQMPSADQNYLARLISTRTGISETDAQQRVSDVVGAARQAEDTARKATAHFLLWLFFSLLMGAFSASYAATIGGRQRDHVVTA